MIFIDWEIKNLYPNLKPNQIWFCFDNPGHSSQKHFHYDNVSAQFSQLECAHRCTQAVSLPLAVPLFRTRSRSPQDSFIALGKFSYPG